MILIKEFIWEFTYNWFWSKSIYKEFTKILLLSETHRRTRHASSETDMPDQIPIGDLNMLHPRPTCLIWDPLETNMPNRKTTRDGYAWLETHRRPWYASSETYRHAVLQWGIVGFRWSPMGDVGFRWSPMGHVGFIWVTNVACWGLW